MFYGKTVETPVQQEDSVARGIGTVQMQRIIASSDKLFGEGRAVVIQSLKPGTSIGLHSHTGEIEILYVLSGTGEHVMNDTIQDLCPGDLLVVYPGEVHGYSCTGEELLKVLAVVIFTDKREKA